MALKHGMTLDLCLAYIIMLMLVSMTLTLMHGHSGSTKTKCQRRIITVSTNKQAIIIKLATTVGNFLPDLIFNMFFMA